MKLIYIILSSFTLIVFICAAETNRVFITYEPFLFRSDGKGGIKVIDKKKVEEAKKSRESLPAEAFPEGNWGPAQEGFQLSLRFGNQSYELGQPISATILVRNVTNTVLDYPVFFTSGTDGPITFHVTTEDEKPVSPKPRGEIDVISSKKEDVYPGTQRKYVQKLDNLFDLKPGTFIVRAQLNVRSKGKPLKILSGKTAIKIVPSADVPDGSGAQ